MRWSDIPFRPPVRVLRQFAVLGFLLLGGLGCWDLLLSGEPLRGGIYLALALVVGLVGLLFPRTIRPLFVGWMCLVFPLSWAISYLLLAFLFYGILTPLGLFFRLVRRDVLVLRPRAGYDSYWSPKPPAEDAASYFRQS